MSRFYANSQFTQRKGFWKNVVLSLISTIVILLLIEAPAENITENMKDGSTGWILWNLLSFVLVILLYMLAAKFLFKRSMPQLGFTSQGWLKQYGIGALLGFGMITLVFLILWISGTITVTNSFDSSVMLPTILMFIMFIIQGMSEEVMIRGYLMPELSAYLGRIPGIIISSIVFAVLHGANPGITKLALLNLFIFAVCMAVLYYATGNLWVVGACHAMWNFFQGNIYGAQVSGIVTPSVLSSQYDPSKEVINGGPFGFEGGLMTTFAYIIGLIVFLWFTRRSRRA